MVPTAEIIPFPIRKPAPEPTHKPGQFVEAFQELTAMWKAAGLWQEPKRGGAA